MVGLKAAVHLDGGIANTEDAFALAPGSDSWDLPTNESIQPLNQSKIETHETQPGTIRM